MGSRRMGVATLLALALLGLTPVTAQAADPVFFTNCALSHVAQDDPIVSPGTTSGHVHEFFANTTTNRDSTYASMRVGGTTCALSGDTAGYWIPTVLIPNGSGGFTTVTATTLNAYYRPTYAGDTVTPDVFPANFRMVSVRPTVASQKGAYWSCGPGTAATTLPSDCGSEYIRANVAFPSCWNGVKDPQNDSASVAYPPSSAIGCPAAYPIHLPRVALVLTFPYKVFPPGTALSSGDLSSLHGDFWNTWNQPALRTLVTTCLAPAAAACGRQSGTSSAAPPLTVAIAGSGAVSSNPAGISCPPYCAASFSSGTSVVLHATPAADHVLSGWSSPDPGPGCPGVDECTVTMDQARSVTATFTAAAHVTHDLTVSTDGTGTGSVTSTPAGIACSSATSPCTGSFDEGSQVVLHAAPDLGAAFAGWAGDVTCSGTGDCTVTMDQARSVTATFQPARSLGVAITGEGTVTSQPAGIACPGTCVASFDPDAQVVLHAAESASSRFTGWTSQDTGFDCATTGDCTVTMDRTRSVTATFAPILQHLSVTIDGSGSGGVTSTPAGIDCTSQTSPCGQEVPQGQQVVLHASPTPGSIFTGWSAAGCPGTGDCTVTLDGPVDVSATFQPAQILTLDVSPHGTVTSDVGGLSCTAATAPCTHAFVQGTVVTLTATVAAGSSFTGWSGACTGIGTCQVTMDQARSVGALFTLNTLPCGRIAFVSNGSGNTDVWTMNADGSGQVNLTGAAGSDTDPAWSPDCSRIAFSSDRAGTYDIWTMDAGGGDLRQLTSGSGADTQPAWAPGGASIAFTGDRNGNEDVFVMSSSGGAATSLTTNIAADAQPSWSPDGASIAFMSKRSGTNIWVMSASGANQTKITAALGTCQMPDWSPSGARIAFASKASGSSQIWTMNANGTGAIRITADARTDLHPSWAPGGAEIAFQSNTAGNNDIWVIEANGTAPVNRAKSRKAETSPSWS